MVVAAADKGVEIAAKRGKVTKQNLDGKALAVDGIHDRRREFVSCLTCAQSLVGKIVVVIFCNDHIVSTHKVFPFVGVLVMAVARALRAAVVCHQSVLDVAVFYRNKRLNRFGLGGLDRTLGQDVREFDLHQIDHLVPHFDLGREGGIFGIQTCNDVVFVTVQEVLAVYPLSDLVDLIDTAFILPNPDGSGPQTHLRVNGLVNVLCNACLAVVRHLHDIALECLAVGSQQTSAAKRAEVV